MTRPLKTKAGSPLNSAPARVLQALRAGQMTGQEISERLPNAGQYLAALKRDGLIVPVGAESYAITPKGLAACPPRNPASVMPRTIPRTGANVHGPTGHAPDMPPLEVRPL